MRKETVEQLVKIADAFDEVGLHDDASDIDRVIRALVQREKDESKGVIRVSILDMMGICKICAHEMVDNNQEYWTLSEGELED